MPHSDTWAIVFALCSALCMALGAVMRQRVTATDGSAPESSAAAALGRKDWWLGTAVGLGGFAFQALALASGPLLLVQPLLVTSLLFILVLGAVLSAHRPTVQQCGLAALLTVSVAALLVLGNPAPGHGHIGMRVWSTVAAGAVLVALGALFAARRFPGNVRAMVLGGASGALFGGTAIITKQLTVRIDHHGLLPGLISWETPALVGVAALAIVLQQFSYRAGNLHASFPAALVTEQVVATGLGILLLGERIAAGGVRTVLAVLAVIVCVAAVRLAVSDTEAAPDRR